MNYELKKLSSDEELKICAQIMSTCEPWISLNRTYEKALLIFNNHDSEVFVAKDNNETLGFVILKMQGAFVPYIQSIGIRQQYRGKGLGSQIIGDIEKMCFKKHPNIFLCVSSFNVKAKMLYVKLGYEIIGELKDYIVKGHAEFILRKSISAINDFEIKENIITDEIVISTDKSKLNLDLIHQVLASSYWSPGIIKEKVIRGIQNSLCFGLYKKEEQIGFARVVTDFARFGYLMDVFIVDSQKGKGYGKLLMNHIMQKEEIHVDKWLLGTRDAHSLYAKFGFTGIKEPGRLMEKKISR